MTIRVGRKREQVRVVVGEARGGRERERERER